MVPHTGEERNGIWRGLGAAPQWGQGGEAGTWGLTQPERSRRPSTVLSASPLPDFPGTDITARRQPRTGVPILKGGSGGVHSPMGLNAGPGIAPHSEATSKPEGF